MATPIFHITSFGNVASIVAAGGLACFSSLQSGGTQYASIAHESVQSHRAIKRVPCGPRGVLHDYVPFYWAPRSPMLYTISRGNVPTCTNGQRDVIYLVSNAENVRNSECEYVFTDGHGIMQLTQYYDDLSDLGEIDWDVMQARYWRDTDEDGDRRRRRQAEFLVHEFFPLSLLDSVAVMRPSDVDKASKLFEPLGRSIEITAKPGWYY